MSANLAVSDAEQLIVRARGGLPRAGGRWRVRATGSYQ